jgi:hypothetical protein
MNRADLAGVSTHGLHSATWRNIRKALRKLGGRPIPATNNHDSTLMELPTFVRVTTGKAKDTDEQVRVAGLQQLLYEIENARLDPLLFLAVLDGVGCAWHAKPDLVTLLERFLRHNGCRVSSESSWKRALTEFYLYARTRSPADDTAHENEEEATTVPHGITTEPAPEPAAPTEQVTPPATPAEAPTNPASTHPFVIPDVIATAGVPAGEHARARVFIENASRSNSGPIPRLLASGDAIYVQHPDRPTARQLRFNDHAAFTTAELLTRKFPPATPEPTQPQEASVPQPEPTPPDRWVPPTGDTSRSVTPDASPQPRVAPEVAAPPEFASAGAAITYLCFRHGVIPAFDGVDPLCIDLSATVLALANATRAQEE